MKPWQSRLEESLHDAQAAPVLSRDLLARYACSARGNITIPQSTLTVWIRQAVNSGRLMPVVRGLYLNRFQNSQPELADAVPWFHKDAVVSLTTVLGDAGVFNNPSSNTVTAVVPFDKGTPPPHLGRRKTAAGMFHFFGMPRAVLEAGKADDRLIAGDRYAHARATPEKALLDWLYLGHSPRSRRPLPPRNDMDMSMLNIQRLKRLARAAGMEEVLENWLG